MNGQKISLQCVYLGCWFWILIRTLQILVVLLGHYLTIYTAAKLRHSLRGGWDFLFHEPVPCVSSCRHVSFLLTSPSCFRYGFASALKTFCTRRTMNSPYIISVGALIFGILTPCKLKFWPNVRSGLLYCRGFFEHVAVINVVFSQLLQICVWHAVAIESPCSKF